MGSFSNTLLIVAAPFVGSFLGVVVQRLPTGRPIIFGRSICACGGYPLQPRDLVPIASWALNRGRCRRCARDLGRFYPLIEVSALLIVLWSVAVMPPEAAWTGALLGWTLLTLGWIDHQEFILPDILTLPLGTAGLVLAALFGEVLLFDAMIGAVAGYAVLMVIAHLYVRWRGREGLGRGDAKLFAAIGAWVGWQGLPTVMLYAAIGGLIVAAILAVRRGPPSRDTALPFGPFLCGGAWLVWLYGPLIVA